MLSFKGFLREGVHDPAIFHAVFMAGGPGSGKDYVMARTLHGHGLREINSDTAFEHAMKKKGLDPKMPPSEQEVRDAVRAGAKKTTEVKKELAERGRNGLIINGTGAEPEKYQKIKDHLESLGYKTHMVFVHTDNKMSRQRNIERGQRGGRTVPEEVRQKSWDDVQRNKEHYRKLFGPNYHEVNNSMDMLHAPKELVDVHSKNLDNVHKHFRKVTGSKEYTPTAQKWISQQMKKEPTLKEEDEYPASWTSEQLRWFKEVVMKDEYYDIPEKDLTNDDGSGTIQKT